MTAKIKNLKNKVLAVLEEYPQTRDSDQYLTLIIWKKYYPSRIFKVSNGSSAILLKDIMEMPREDNIKRVRAIIQNVENKFLPTSLEVAKQRKINEETWREYVRFNH